MNLLCASIADWDQVAIELILKQDIDVNAKNVNGTAALITAVKTRHRAATVNLVAVLLIRGADVNATDSTGRTPLIHVCNQPNPYIELFTLLLANGGDVSITTDTCSPLSCAIHYKHYGLMTRLCVLGAEPDRFALLAAIDHANYDIFALLIDRGAELNALHHGLTPLLRLARVASFSRQHFEMAVLLIDRGADVEAKDAEGVTALSRLCRLAETASEHRCSIVRRLLVKGANADAVDNKGCNALKHLLNGSCNESIIDALLKHGASASRYYENGDTPLIWLVKRNITNSDQYARALLLLLKREVDTNIPNYLTGDTALMAACKREKTHIFQLLLEHGADATAVNHEGLSVADLLGDARLMVQLHALYVQYVDQNVPKCILK